MKVRPVAPALVPYVAEMERRYATHPAAAPAAEPAWQASLSTPARIVQEIGVEARVGGPSQRYRPDLVASIRAEIAAGTFGGPADVERTVDALLGEL
jgi:hypothetical protein